MRKIRRMNTNGVGCTDTNGVGCTDTKVIMFLPVYDGENFPQFMMGKIMR